MNDFESERAAKAARFRQLAGKHANIPTGRHFVARERLEMIPLGQPILVGHHWEKRHRRDLKRIDEHFAKRSNITIKPNTFRRRAAAAESNVMVGSALSGRLPMAKNSLCASGQTTAICTWRYTPALAVLTITRAPISGG
jgi:hypothetical protein